MEHFEPSYKVYIRTDDKNRIVAVHSSAFLRNTQGWTQIDEGTEWPKYMHAQGNYFPKPIYTEDGIPRYKLEEGVAVERTAEEIEADRAAVPEPETEKSVWDELDAAYREGVEQA